MPGGVALFLFGGLIDGHQKFVQAEAPLELCLEFPCEVGVGAHLNADDPHFPRTLQNPADPRARHVVSARQFFLRNFLQVVKRSYFGRLIDI